MTLIGIVAAVKAQGDRSFPYAFVTIDGDGAPVKVLVPPVVWAGVRDGITEGAHVTADVQPDADGWLTARWVDVTVPEAAP